MTRVIGSSLFLIGWLLCTAVATALEVSGPRQQGGLLEGRVEPGTRIEALGQQVPVDGQGRFLVGLDRDAPAEVVLTVTSPEGEGERYRLDITQRDYDIQRIDGLPNAQVNPDADTLARIRREAAWVREARAQGQSDRLMEDAWQWPVTGPISGIYGSQRILNGEPRQPHYGIDIARPTGTPVRAPASGVVTLAEPDLFFSGGTLIVDHGQGLSSTFLHLSAMAVAPGDLVRQGEVIAEVGATGRVTGAHLDWRMNWLNQRIDPSLLVPPMPEAAP